MTTITHDERRLRAAAVPAGSRRVQGLLLAIVSATAFSMSGPLARGLLDAGWSPGAVAIGRTGIAAVVLTPLAVLSLRGRWRLLRGNFGVIVAYGALAVAGAQFSYFSAVQHMQVGPALLIEYTAPAAVVVWLWLRHGQRPGRMTLLGAGFAGLGLVLVLDLVSGADLDTTGVLWALAAMLGLAAYFLISSDQSNGLPPLALAAGGLVVGTVTLGAFGAAGVMSMATSASTAVYAGRPFDWWVPLAALGLVTAALAYTTGIAAGRRLGSRLASFVALLEVVAGVGFAWLLLDQLPQAIQLAGGGLILAGVIAVQLGERTTSSAAIPPTHTGRRGWARRRHGTDEDGGPGGTRPPS